MPVADRRPTPFCCPGDDQRRGFSSHPVATTLCCLLQAMALAGLLAATVTSYWRSKHWSIGEHTYRRYWGLWQACTRMYAERGLRLRSHHCYSRLQAGLEGDRPSRLETACLALLVFACAHALVGALLQVVCCLRSPCCLIAWALLGAAMSGVACVAYFVHFRGIEGEHRRTVAPVVGRVQETTELSWSFYLALASTACQTLLIAAMIAFFVYAGKRTSRGTALPRRTHSGRSGESFV